MLAVCSHRKQRNCPWRSRSSSALLLRHGPSALDITPSCPIPSEICCCYAWLSCCTRQQRTWVSCGASASSQLLLSSKHDSTEVSNVYTEDQSRWCDSDLLETSAVDVAPAAHIKCFGISSRKYTTVSCWILNTTIHCCTSFAPLHLKTLASG